MLQSFVGLLNLSPKLLVTAHLPCADVLICADRQNVGCQFAATLNIDRSQQGKGLTRSYANEAVMKEGNAVNAFHI